MALTFLAGSKLRASDLNKILPVQKRKAAPESVASNTTLHNDNTLFVALAANTTYKVDLAVLFEAANQTTDIKVAWTFPASCTLDLAVAGPHANWTGPAALEVEWSGWQNVTTSPSGVVVFGSASAVNFGIHARGTIVVGANTGNLQLQWAQNTSDPGNLTVKSGSSLILTPIA